jgi:UDP-glucose-4-epimerase GalE
MNILVTGGAGYIGSHFCKAANLAGHKLFVVDDLSTGHKEFVKWGTFYHNSIADVAVIKNICTEKGIEAVVHFAAKSIVSESVLEPELYQQNNVEGTKALLSALEGTSVKYFIFSSTAATYGEPLTDVISEKTPQNPINPYGQTKLECEKLILAQKKLKIGILRYFNVVGQDPQGEIYEKHLPETHLIPNIIKAMELGTSFGLFGQDYLTIDGTCIRDYVDVNDLALVHLEALRHISTSPIPLISNVGRGKGESIKQVLDAFQKVFGGLPQIVPKPRRQGDPPRLVASDKYFRMWCAVPLRSLEDSLKTMRKNKV